MKSAVDEMIRLAGGLLDLFVVAAIGARQALLKMPMEMQSFQRSFLPLKIPFLRGGRGVMWGCSCRHRWGLSPG